MKTHGWESYPVYLSQDGSDPKTAAMAESYVQKNADRRWARWNRPRIPQLGNDQPSTAYLAQHYGYGLKKVFEELGHSHAIILEDDMILSVDFLDLFEQTAWLLEADPTLWCVSSWNDNGFKEYEWQPAALFRNSFFPGLGWMMRRELWDDELGAIWPQIHWDHWMRSNANGRDCICPEVSRNHNIGAQGATMQQSTFNQRLSNIIWAEGGAPTDFGDLSYLLRDNYGARLRDQIHAPGMTVHDGRPELINWARAGAGPVVVPYMAEQYRSYTLKLKLWDMPRTHFQFITRLDVKGKGRIFMVDMRKSPEWAMPHPDYAHRQDPSFQAIQASGPGINCVSVCQQLGKRCAADHFDFLNSCAALKAAFGCPKGCHMEWGGDLPALVIGPTNPRKGICMVVETPDVTGCGGSHAQTVRLCPCVG